MPPRPSRASLTVVGDIHRFWRPEDGAYLENGNQDLTMFVGDLGDEDLDMVRAVATLDIPKVVILGNHDAFKSFIDKRPTRALRESMELIGDDHMGYGVREFPEAGVSIVGARPFSWGGQSLRSPEVYSEFYGVRTAEDSARKIVEGARRAQHRDLLILAHNGPKGLGRAPSDIYGKDFGKPGGDWGDRDLEIALQRIRELKLRVRCVIAGHMHNRLAFPKGKQRTRFLKKGDTLYVNPAIVPRVRKVDGVEVGHFMRMEWAGGELLEMDEVWVDGDGRVVERWEPRVKEV